MSSVGLSTEPPRSPRRAECVLDQLVGDGADQDARSEGHEEPERAQADWVAQGEKATEQERGGGDKPPPEETSP